MNSPVFEWVAQTLEEASSLTRLEARGTVRLALREVGLTVTGVARRPMLFVLKKILPRFLHSRGVPEPERICIALAARLEQASLPSVGESPEHVFARMGGDIPDDR